jgi:hypothetical protein
MLHPVKTMKVYAIDHHHDLYGSFTFHAYQVGLKRLGATLNAQDFFNTVLKTADHKKHTLKDKRYGSEIFIKTEALECQEKKHLGFAKIGDLNYLEGIGNDICWQFFLPEGIIGLLPKNDHCCHFVFSSFKADQPFPSKTLKLLFKKFSIPLDHRVVNISDPNPIYSFHRASYRYQKTILLSGALHQIHPLAGQGMNLNLADLQVFLERLKAGDKEREYRKIQKALIDERYKKNLLMTHFCALAYQLYQPKIIGQSLNAFHQFNALKYALFEHYQQCSFTHCCDLEKI